MPADKQWQWIVDMTKDEPKPPPSKANKEFRAMLRQQTWLRAEERVGRWIGFVVAVLFWSMMAVSYYNYTMQPKPVMYYDSETKTMKQIPGYYNVGGEKKFLQDETK